MHRWRARATSSTTTAACSTPWRAIPPSTPGHPPTPCGAGANGCRSTSASAPRCRATSAMKAICASAWAPRGRSSTCWSRSRAGHTALAATVGRLRSAAPGGAGRVAGCPGRTIRGGRGSTPGLLRPGRGGAAAQPTAARAWRGAYLPRRAGAVRLRIHRSCRAACAGEEAPGAGAPGGLQRPSAGTLHRRTRPGCQPALPGTLDRQGGHLDRGGSTPCVFLHTPDNLLAPQQARRFHAALALRLPGMPALPAFADEPAEEQLGLF